MMYRPVRIVWLSGIAFFILAGAAQAGPRDAILDDLHAAAQAEDAGFSGFDAARGEAFFIARHASGKPETPACTSCHDADPTKGGMTRAGKVIAPMAVSVTPDRFTDPDKVAKWFYRNCNSVLGRECTATEKGDVLTYLTNR